MRATKQKPKTPRMPVDPGLYDRAFDRWSESLPAGTRRSYADGVRRFATWLGRHLPGQRSAMTAGDAASRLLQLDGRRAAGLVAAWQAAAASIPGEAGRRAIATANLDLAALRALCHFAASPAGGRLVDWDLRSVSYVRSPRRRRREVPRVSVAAARKLLEAAREGPCPARDHAVLCLLLDCEGGADPLKRGELVALDRQDVDVRGRRLVRVIGRGGRVYERSVTHAAAEALGAWIEARAVHLGDDAPGPLFFGLDVGARARLTGGGLWFVLRSLAGRAGLGTVTPEELRAAAKAAWAAGVTW